MSRLRVKLALTCVLVLVCAPGARAESSFSLNLLGERIDAGDARAVALGASDYVLKGSTREAIIWSISATCWARSISFLTKIR